MMLRFVDTEPKHNKRIPRALRFATYLLVGSAALSACSASESSQQNSDPKATTTASTLSSQSPEATTLSANGKEAKAQIESFATEKSEAISGYSTAEILRYLNGVTDLQGKNLYDYYYEADSAKSAKELGIKDALASELTTYLSGSPEQVQDLVNRKQLSMQDLAYVYQQYTKIVPKLAKIDKQAQIIKVSPDSASNSKDTIHGVAIKSAASLAAAIRIAQLTVNGKVMLEDLSDCSYDPAKDYTNATFNLLSGDGFIALNASTDPAETPLFSSDRFNPYYSEMSSVGTFGLIKTDRAKQCGAPIVDSANKMLLPYITSAMALDIFAQDDFATTDNPELEKLAHSALIDVLDIDPADYKVANTYKEQ